MHSTIKILGLLVLLSGINGCGKTVSPDPIVPVNPIEDSSTPPKISEENKKMGVVGFTREGVLITQDKATKYMILTRQFRKEALARFSLDLRKDPGINVATEAQLREGEVEPSSEPGRTVYHLKNSHYICFVVMNSWRTTKDPK